MSYDDGLPRVPVCVAFDPDRGYLYYVSRDPERWSQHYKIFACQVPTLRPSDIYELTHQRQTKWPDHAPDSDATVFFLQHDDQMATFSIIVSVDEKAPPLSIRLTFSRTAHRMLRVMSLGYFEISESGNTAWLTVVAEIPPELTRI